MKTNLYDAIVIGAGVGGLTVAALLAHQGRKVLLVEKSNRVGGRAKTLGGREILEHGETWYRDMLGQQYCWLAKTIPTFPEIQQNRLLDGYRLDLGYHGVSLNGRGYFYDLDQIIGSGEQAGVRFAGNVNATYIDEDWYLDFHAGKLDPRINAIVEENESSFLDFYFSAMKMGEADFNRFESVSLAQWCRERGIDRQHVLYEMLHAVGTLITTINDPDEISVGDIFRYFGEVINPRFKTGVARYPSGFAVGGIQQWMDSVRDRFLHFSGELWLETTVQEILVAEGKVRGVKIRRNNGSTIEVEAPIVVSNIPTQETFRYIDRALFPVEYVNRTEKLKSYGSIAPYFGLKSLALPQEQWKLGMKDTLVIPKGNRFSHDIYMCWNIQSQTDPLCAPEGKHLLTAYAPVTEDEARDKELMFWACEQIVEYLERRYPGFKESIEWALFPVSWRLEGVAKDVNQAGTLKTPVRAPNLEGLFFTGDTVKGYGVAMDCACAAGLICASEITGQDYGVY
ncbi:MAG: FAD-dependent oxidoreductase [Chloroflexi bacterium]|nr:FAD-dependent oxidoreductase [Chloroflexota bacterium]